MNRLRLAKYDDAGQPVFDTEVLSAEELAIDYGWITPRRAPVDLDPGLVDEVARLQERAS